MLSIGIVGLPNVGKSTLFNALTRKAVHAENYPFCTIDPSVGVVAVPDERLDKLAVFSKSAKVIPAAVEFVDIAGLVKGAAQGEGLGNKFLAHIREVDAIAHIVRVFEGANILHVHGSIDPVNDIEVINLELIIADQETVDKRLASIEKDARRGDKEALMLKAVLEKFQQALANEKPAASVELSKEETLLAKGLHLLTMKPTLYVLNTKTGSESAKIDEVKKYLTERREQYIVLDVGVEHELKDVEHSEKRTYRKELGVADDGVDGLIRAGYELLRLMTYFTTGPDETRGWTVKRGSTAPEAGTAIHTDFRDKFIRAEVINWQTLLDAGSYAAAREKGLLHLEGKQYVVQDGDVVEFKI